MHLTDYHIHTHFSSDSNTPMEAAVESAIAKGLKEIAITDHMDLDYPDPDFPFLLDFKAYFTAFSALQEKYSNLITMRLGVEIGLQSHVHATTEAFLQAHPFDFIIGSTHCINGIELHNGSFFHGKTQDAAYRAYFEDVLKNVQLFDTFQVYGHVDYINRYGNYPDRTLHHERYQDVIDEILKALIAKGKGLEINTSGFRYGLGYAHPKLEILKRYRSLGGEIITVGSDAHTPDLVASHFDQAKNMLMAAGFQAFTVFEQQKPRWIDLI